MNRHPARRTMVNLALLAVSGVAHGQTLGLDPSGVDLHGEVAPIPRGLAGDPVSTLSAPVGLAGAWGLSVLGEFANDPATLVVQTATGETPIQRPLIDGFAMAHLGGWYAPSRRVALGGALPVFFTAANYTSERPTVGDLYLRGDIGLLLPDDDGMGGSVALVPTLTLPTGNGERLVGGDLRAEGSLVGSLRTRGAALHGALGVRVGERAQLLSQSVGGVQLPLGAAASLRIVDPLWLQAEVRGAVQPGASPSSANEGIDLELLGSPTVPVEGVLSLTSRFGPVWAGGGAGTALSSGIGAARSRGFLGVAYTHLPFLEEAPEVVRPIAELQVVDPNGDPATGAQLVALGLVVARADAEGVLRFELPEAWPSDAEVRLDGFMPVELGVPPEALLDGDPAIVELQWTAVALTPRVTDQDGNEVDAMLTATPVGGGEPLSGAVGELMLPEGTFEISIEAAGFAPQRRTVIVEDGRPPPPFEAVLAPPAGDGELVLAVVDAVSQPVEGARVLVDGVPVGTVAGGSLMGLGGVADSPARVEVLHPAYTASLAEVVPGSPATVVLTRVPGTVRVRAVGPEGAPVDDAVVRFLGPSRLEPAPLGLRGERVQVLSPGTWDVLVSSPSHGLQRRTIDIEPEQYELLEVVVQLQTAEGGAADLRVAVIDPEGLPVGGVELHLDDRAYGETSSGGTVEVTGLTVGSRELWVLGDLLRPVPERAVDLVAGLVEEVVPVRWVEGAVEVRVLGPDGPVTDAVVRMLGEGEPEILSLNADGMVRTVVAPGTWTVLASSPTLGLQQRSVTVAADADVLHRVDVVLSPPEGGLADLAVMLVDPDGLPVGDAAVALDGVPLGRTGPEGDLRLQDLAVGDRVLEVVSALHEPWTSELQLMEGPQQVEGELDWAPGVARATVVADGAPLSDAIVRWLGPTLLPPQPVDAAGRATARLSPGTWQVLASSPTAGVAQQTVEVPAGLADRLEVTIDMVAPTAGVASLALRVVDPAGLPVVGAVVASGGVELGTTGAGGVWLGEGLVPGPLGLMVAHPAYGEELLSVSLAAGAQQRTVELPWVEKSVAVTVVGPSGDPVSAAELTLVGPVDVAPQATDGAGRAQLTLVPGTWQVIAAGDGLGTARAEVVVGAESVEPVQLALGQAELEVSEQLIALRRQVLFDFGASELTEDAGPVLDQVANALLTGAVLRVEVQGHTDNVGGAAVNQALSEARAQSVRAALITRGVPRETLIARGYGPQRPVADNGTEVGRAQNRRVQFAIEERAQ